MYFLNAKRLITMAIEHGILQAKDDKVLIYRDAGSDPEKYPEGWLRKTSMTSLRN